MEASALSIRMYNFFRKDLNLSESQAQEYVQIIDEAIKQKSADKQDQNVELFHKDMQSLKDYMDVKFGEMDKRFASKEDLANTRYDMLKWMFIFWIGQVAATFGFILLFLKK